MSELLTDAQLTEREAAWNTNGRSDPAKFAQFACEQEPALLARLREAERLLLDMDDHISSGEHAMPDARMKAIDAVDAYFAQVRAPHNAP